MMRVRERIEFVIPLRDVACTLPFCDKGRTLRSGDELTSSDEASSDDQDRNNSVQCPLRVCDERKGTSDEPFEFEVSDYLPS